MRERFRQLSRRRACDAVEQQDHNLEMVLVCQGQEKGAVRNVGPAFARGGVNQSGLLDDLGACVENNAKCVQLLSCLHKLLKAKTKMVERLQILALLKPQAHFKIVVCRRGGRALRVGKDLWRSPSTACFPEGHVCECGTGDTSWGHAVKTDCTISIADAGLMAVGEGHVRAMHPWIKSTARTVANKRRFRSRACKVSQRCAGDSKCEEQGFDARWSRQVSRAFSSQCSEWR